MGKGKTLILGLLCGCFMVGCSNTTKEKQLATTILQDSTLNKVDSMARSVIRQGLNAGSGYSQIWARDMNTFIETACEETDRKDLRNAILLFFALQQPNGEMIDGYVLKPEFTWNDNVPYYSDAAPQHVAFKNTVETDQESSLIQIVGKYIRMTGDRSILQENIAGSTVLERMTQMTDYLMRERYSEEYGLLYGAMTADWGDVQPCDDFGCDMNEKSFKAIDVYDNAMFIIALDYLQEMSQNPEEQKKWKDIRENFAKNVRTHLWDEKNQKFIPHIYLDKSPIPEGFDENKVHYHGGTAVAIEAGLLTRRNSNRQSADAGKCPPVGYAQYWTDSLSSLSGKLLYRRNGPSVCLSERRRLDLVRRTDDPAVDSPWIHRRSLRGNQTDDRPGYTE